MWTCGGGAPIGQGVYITQRRLKFGGDSIPRERFYCHEHTTTASTSSIISPHLPKAG